MQQSLTQLKFKNLRSPNWLRLAAALVTRCLSEAQSGLAKRPGCARSFLFTVRHTAVASLARNKGAYIANPETQPLARVAAAIAAVRRVGNGRHRPSTKRAIIELSAGVIRKNAHPQHRTCSSPNGGPT